MRKKQFKCPLLFVFFVYSFGVCAADNTSAQIQMLNSQLQAQLQQMQDTQQKQIKELNTQLQKQLSTLQKDLQTKIETVNTQTQEQMKTLKADLEKQIMQVYDEATQGKTAEKPKDASDNTPAEPAAPVGSAASKTKE
ncbi:MAG: hypothetical protein ACOYKA_00460 [Legionellaceae bacterium]